MSDAPTEHETDEAFVARMSAWGGWCVRGSDDAPRLIALAQRAVTQPAAAPDARLREALERICDATPKNTHSPTAESMASWCHAVARCALDEVGPAAAPDAGGGYGDVPFETMSDERLRAFIASRSIDGFARVVQAEEVLAARAALRAGSEGGK